MAKQLKNDSEGDLHTCTKIFCDYDSDNSNSTCDSLQFLLDLLKTNKESYVKEILFAQSMFPEFFMKAAIKALRMSLSESSLASINNADSESNEPEKSRKLCNDAIEIWYIKEYGLGTS